MGSLRSASDPITILGHWYRFFQWPRVLLDFELKMECYCMQELCSKSACFSISCPFVSHFSRAQHMFFFSSIEISGDNHVMDLLTNVKFLKHAGCFIKRYDPSQIYHQTSSYPLHGTSLSDTLSSNFNPM